MQILDVFCTIVKKKASIETLIGKEKCIFVWIGLKYPEPTLTTNLQKLSNDESKHAAINENSSNYLIRENGTKR